MICLVIWCCRVEFLCGWVHLRVGVFSVVIVFVFVFVWASFLSISCLCLSSCSRLICRFRVCVRLRMVAEPNG